MLRDNNTGLYYRRTRGNFDSDPWVKQKKATVWSSRNGPAQARSYQLAHGRTKLQIVPFELVEKP